MDQVAVRQSLRDALVEAQEQGKMHLVPYWQDSHGLVLAFLQETTGQITEVPLGRGPFFRPSRQGVLSFTFFESQFPKDLWYEPDVPHRVSGEGLHVLPLGPVRADVAESLRFELSVIGDEIHHVTLFTGFKRRAVGQACSHAPLEEALGLAERVDATAAFAHALAFVTAVEDALGLSVSEEHRRLRSLLAEWERIGSHLHDLALLAASTGAVAPAQDLFRLRERVLRAMLEHTGHRYLRGVLAPGGSRRTLLLPAKALARLREEVGNEFSAIHHALSHMHSFLDRLHGAGRIPDESLSHLSLTGYVGKSTGESQDMRWLRPYAAYGTIGDRQVPVSYPEPDAFGRYAVRCREILQSLDWIGTLEDDLVCPALNEPAFGHGTGYGIVEAPKGRLVYRVEVSGDHTGQVALATPSQWNWPAFPAAVAHANILQDFPIIEASFALSVAELDL